MGYISRDCPNRDAMGGPSSRRVTFADDEGKDLVNLVEIQDETREKAIANFEQSLRKEVDVMAAKQMQDEYQQRNVKRMKEMARDKGSKKSRRRRLGFHDFPISQNQGSYSILDDMVVKKADITIGQLVAIVPSVRKKLKKSLYAHKIPSIPHSPNAIAVQQEYDPIIDFGCNGSILRGVLVDRGADVNVMTIPAMRYIGLEIKRPSSITLKLANKKIYKPQGMISNVCINFLGISTAVDFHVVLDEDGSYPMILGRPWLTKAHVKVFMNDFGIYGD
jgi:hypothetical protein